MTNDQITVDGQTYQFHRVAAIAGIAQLPLSLQLLAENLLRNGQDPSQLTALANWDPTARAPEEVQFAPARVVMQDFTGVPCLADLAALRQAVAAQGGDITRVQPVKPTELVIDHSIVVDVAGSPQAYQCNVDLEYQRNAERYQFLRWGQGAFTGFRVVPPGSGIVHQVNLEHLARGVIVEDGMVFPDSCVGTDSHTTMIGGLGILGWGVGGIEAEAVMLGQSISLLIPPVVGVHLSGRLADQVTATDLVLTLTQQLRALGVVGKFVEFDGPGVYQLPLAHRATIANMSPEFGSTCALFPIDQTTCDYYRLTGREPHQVALIAEYAKAQGWWAGEGQRRYSEELHFDLASVEPSLAGPKRPQDRIALRAMPTQFRKDITNYLPNSAQPQQPTNSLMPGQIADGAVVIAAITSCTNTANPAVMVAAGLLAKAAVQRGLTSKSWVKTSLAPGSRVVSDYLEQAGLAEPLAKLGFQTVGYGCTTCIGNSGPLAASVTQAIEQDNLVVASVLSGNRNFEGRINPLVAMNYLASPPLVVAYALAGRVDFDFDNEPLGYDTTGQPVFLKNLWPSAAAVNQIVGQIIQPNLFSQSYSHIFSGDNQWQALAAPTGAVFDFAEDSTYLRCPPFLENLTTAVTAPTDITNARVLALLGDSVTTDHISPAGAIKADSPAGRYLADRGVAAKDFNSYGSRRGNHEVMVRGTFANIRLRNQLVSQAGGWTRNQITGETVTIFDAAQYYADANIPLLVIAGKEYGTGSSRDWAAKGTALLGVKAVLAQSFERIHRSNLAGMGVLPLQFIDGHGASELGLDGSEEFTVTGITAMRQPGSEVVVTARRNDGWESVFPALVRLDTPDELECWRQGGILPQVWRALVAD